MTRQEAIERIKNDIELNHNCLANEYITALNMAIEALSENKRTDKHTETHACDCISRQAAIDGEDSK